jgi:cytochrome c oxidase accessory protein FixG
VFYAVFARFREQACTLACPYGRMMSSLIDRRTVTVTYDRGRGEPRGKVSAGSRGSDAHVPAVGHCVDCHQCVTVCPTGIDIRNGIQLECVNCTACIDACDDVMDRLSRPRGLIRLTSVEALESRTPWWSARVKAYAAVWLVLVVGVSAALVSRRPIDVLVLRQPGTLFATLPNGEIANFYTVQSFNRTAQPVHFDLEVTQPAGAGATLLGAVGDVRPNALAEGRLLVHVPASQLHGGTTSIQFVVLSGGKVVQTITSSFVGPQ